ncbi:MAG: HAD family phosphatase [Anaerolineales bacterium]|nr:HAD family phosphatase [Anaerolineales bacterium]
MKISAVIFDFGGVIVRTEDRSSREQLAEELNMTYDQLSDAIFASESARLASLGRITAEDHWEAVRKALGLNDNDLPRIRDLFWAGDTLDFDLVDLIRSFRPGYRTALLSNAWDDLRGMLTGHWKIADAFDTIVISAEEGVVKPYPQIYETTLERLHLDPGQAVFVDDFIENIQGAQAVGMQTIHFRSIDQTRAELKKYIA